MTLDNPPWWSAQFERHIAQRMAVICATAYDPPEAMMDLFAGNEVQFLRARDTEVFVIDAGDIRVVAFRGTEVSRDFSWTDIKDNAKIGMTKVTARCGYNVEVHRGYLAALDAATEAAAELIEDLVPPVIYTGHSLGGCLATLAAVMWKPPSAVYSFGAPKVSGRILGAVLGTLGIPVFRVVYANDIAPKHPLAIAPAINVISWLWGQTVPTGYRHIGEFWHLAEDGALARENWGWRHQLLVPLTTHGITAGAADHSIDNYVDRL